MPAHWMTPWWQAGGGIFALHALFYAVFVPRWLMRRAAPRGAAGPAASAQDAAPGLDQGAASGRGAAEAGASRPIARGSALPLALHAAAMMVLYIGLDLALLPARVRPAMGARLGRGAALALSPLVPPQRLAGAMVILGAAALAAWTLLVFRSWRLRASLDHGHELCTAGPFRRVRHPIYLAMDLLAVGSWLWAPTALVGLGAVLVAVGGDLRARGEERLLLSVFGERYAEVRRRVRRFVPGIY